MPPCPAPHLVAYLFEAGPLQPGGMAEAPLSHGELQAWQQNSGIVLQPWEARLLRRLSGSYLSAMSEARAPSAPPPWKETPDVAPNPARIARDLKASLKELAKL